MHLIKPRIGALALAKCKNACFGHVQFPSGFDALDHLTRYHLEPSITWRALGFPRKNVVTPLNLRQVKSNLLAQLQITRFLGGVKG